MGSGNDNLASNWWQAINCTNVHQDFWHNMSSLDHNHPSMARAGFLCFLSLAPGKLRLCSTNHMPGYFSNLACDWLSIVWAYFKEETENGPRSCIFSIQTAPRHLCQDPSCKGFFHYSYNFTNCIKAISTKFHTWHNSCHVMPCAKKYSDFVIKNKIIAKWLFH